jgi:eukaryotic-like serine/threonine-protein kinase
VYRATDTTRGREVAIKILPDAVASDPERLVRFEREAKTLALLNHPHIAAIYSVEKSGEYRVLHVYAHHQPARKIDVIVESLVVESAAA